MVPSSWRFSLFVALLLSACVSTASPAPTETTSASDSIPTPIDTSARIPTATLTFFDGYQTTLHEHPSPDGRFLGRVLVAIPIADQPQYYTRLEIEGPEGVQVIREGWANYGLGYSVPAILGWSLDGQYLYFADKIVADGYGVFASFETPMRLYVGGTLPETLGVDLRGPLALSPDGRNLATLQDEQLVVADLVQGSLHRIQISIAEGAQAGAVIWSQDGSRLAFTILSNPFRGERPESLIFVSPVPELDPQLVLRQQDMFLQSESWLGEHEIRLRDFNNQIFVLDLETGELRGE